MKKIFIVLSKTGCENNEGHVLVYDICNLLESFNPISYPITYNKKDIATYVLGTLPTDYTVSIDHIGGRPTDRS